MSGPASPAPSTTGRGGGSPPERIPPAIWAVAILMACLASWPFMAASHATPAGWQFSGVVHPSPDFVQYRVWMRQSQTEGPIVTDRFTSEPNAAHLPVFFYYVLGRIARATGASPEVVMALAGAPLAFLLVLLLYDTVRRFLPPGRARGWALFAMIIGGGLGAYLKEGRDIGLRHGIGLVRRLLAVPMQERGGTVFEDLRGTYLFTSVFDTHFLLIWLLAAATILSIYLAITHHSPWRVLLSAGLCGAITLAHVYEGILLLAILGGVVLLLWRRGFEVRSAVITGSACAFVIMGTLMLLALLQRHSGLPMPGWREYPIFLTMFVAGFPVQVMVIVPQLRRYWRESTPADVFLLGWIAGCLAVSFSSPFYPYPGRGLMTLQIPLAIVAASIYFRDRLSMPTSHLIMALLLLGFTPVQVVRNLNRRLQFREDVPRVWLSPEHREILAVLHKTSHPNDILAARPDDVGWLAPEFPGRHYAGHFFLTVDFARKRDEIERLSQLSVEDRERFLLDNGVTLLYMDSAASPASFRGMRGLTPLVENGAGSLFRFSPGPPDGG